MKPPCKRKAKKVPEASGYPMTGYMQRSLSEDKQSTTTSLGDLIWFLLAALFLAILAALYAFLSDFLSRFGSVFTDALQVVLSAFGVISATFGVWKLVDLKDILKRFGITLFVVSGLILFVVCLLYFLRSPIADFYYQKGLTDLQTGFLLNARENLERALRFDSSLVVAYYQLGRLSEELGDFEQARMHYQVAAAEKLDDKTYPTLDLAHNNLGRLLILAGDYDLAIGTLNRGIHVAQDDPAKYSLFKNRGWARLCQQRYPEAKADLKEAITHMNSVNEQASYHRAPHCLLAQALLAEALPNQEHLCQNGIIDWDWQYIKVHLQSTKPLNNSWSDCLGGTQNDPLNFEEDKWYGMAKKYDQLILRR
jgi:tetratricopeptide (TPR) repeat protein